MLMTIRGEDIIKESKNLEEFWELLDEIFSKYGIKPEENAVFVSITCPDDQSSSVLSYIVTRNKYEKDRSKHFLVYNRSVFGGIFVPGYKTFESLIPAAHHIPKSGKNLVVLNFTHIGYEEETGEWGKFIRYGHDHASSSCGAIVTLYSLIKEGKEMVNDEDLRELGMFLRNIMIEENIEEIPRNEHILHLTLKAFERQSSWLLEQLQRLSEREKINILYIGGVEIDMDKKEEFNDKIFVKNITYIERGKKVEKIL